MSILQRGKFSVLLFLIMACSVVAGLDATLQDNREALKEAELQLKGLSKGVKDEKTRSLIKDVYKNAEAVLQLGENADPETAKKALVAVHKLIINLKQNKLKQAEEHSSSCSVCSDLSSIESDLKECCEKIQRQLFDILTILEQLTACGTVIAIDHVPIVLSQSGKYCVKNDLVYDGTGAAITVTANNVQINFHAHSLTLTDPSADGIFVDHADEFVLENDIIQGPNIASLGAAVHLSGVQKATLTNIFTSKTSFGVKIDSGTEDVLIQNSLLQEHPIIGVQIVGSKGITIDSCTFDGKDIAASHVGVWALDDSHNLKITNSTLTGWDFTLIASGNVTDILIDNCMVIGANLGFGNAILAVFGDFTGPANDVIIRNSTFSYPVLIPGNVGLFFLNGSGAVLENVVVDTKTTAAVNGIGSAILVGLTLNPGLFYSNIDAKNCIVKGTNDLGLDILHGFNVTFDNSQFTNASVNNILIRGFSHSCVIKNSLIANGAGNGVLMQLGANDNAILDCEINRQGGNGVFIDAVNAASNIIRGCDISFCGLNGVDIAGDINAVTDCVIRNCGTEEHPTAAGIHIESTALATHVSNNRVFRNQNGIVNGGNATETYFNTACNNVTLDCVNVITSQFPGDAALAGSNVCCNPDGISDQCPCFFEFEK